jgi:putative FmdB family regulatory protein
VPTYQYVCTECGGQLEAVQKFTDEALTVHEDCGGRLRKVFSPAAIVFKGSGFYRTDSRAGGSSSSVSAAQKSDSGSSSDSPAKAGGDSPSKSAGKSGGDAAAKPSGDSAAAKPVKSSSEKVA